MHACNHTHKVSSLIDVELTRRELKSETKTKPNKECINLFRKLLTVSLLNGVSGGGRTQHLKQAILNSAFN